jgi:hypothetical protein
LRAGKTASSARLGALVMTLLGKIFTVLILIMSLVFMTLSAMVFATHKNWKTLVLNPDTRSPGYDGNYDTGLKIQLEQQLAANEQLRKNLEDARNRNAMERANRQAAIASLQSKLQQAEDLVTQKEAELAKLQVDHGDALAELKRTQDNLVALTTEVENLRTDVRNVQQDLETQLSEVVRLTDSLHEAEGMQRRLEERRDQLATQVALMTKVMDAHALTIDTDVDAVEPLVDGYVTSVGAKDFIEISIGKDDGLRPGHQLDVFRGSTYLGRVTVRETSPNRAVAEILKDLRRGQIRKDDRVTTRLTKLG